MEVNEARDAKPTGLAILLSAVVFPGVGQYIQKRRVFAFFYAAIFLVCVFFLFKTIFTPLFLNLRAMEEYLTGAHESVYYPAPWKNIVIWTAISLFAYFASLLDVFVFHRRQVAAWMRRQSGMPENSSKLEVPT